MLLCGWRKRKNKRTNSANRSDDANALKAESQNKTDENASANDDTFNRFNDDDDADDGNGTTDEFNSKSMQRPLLLALVLVFISIHFGNLFLSKCGARKENSKSAKNTSEIKQKKQRKEGKGRERKKKRNLDIHSHTIINVFICFSFFISFIKSVRSNRYQFDLGVLPFALPKEHHAKVSRQSTNSLNTLNTN